MYIVWFLSEGEKVGCDKFKTEEQAIKAGSNWVGNGLYDRGYEIYSSR